MTQAGRRPGTSETREEILSAARRLFGERGYDGTTIRAMAAEAGVNPALVHHFFGTKEQVFVAALDFPFNPAEAFQRIMPGPRHEFGQRVVHYFLTVWNNPQTREPLLALIRSATTNEQAATTFRQFVGATLLGRVADALRIPRLELNAAMAQMVGVALLRYVIKIEPLASASDDEIVQLVAPIIQRYIDGG